MKSQRILALVAIAVLAVASVSGPVHAALSYADEDKPTRQTEVAVGYRSVSSDGVADRAREYDSLQSSATLDARLFANPENFHLDLTGKYLNEDDYFADGHFNMNSQLQLNLRAERFFHNLDHIPYDNGFSGTPPDRTLTGEAAEGSRPDGTFPEGDGFRTYYTDHDPKADYGLRLDTEEASIKLKAPSYPAHLKLSYWRFEKHGSRQLRFLDENCNGCHMQSTTREVNRVSDEFRAGADAHLGYVDLAMEWVYREFRDREAIQQDAFESHSRGREAGEYEHDEAPDSRLNEITVNANTSQSGGFVAAASFTIGQRENLSDLESVTPVEAKTDFYKATSDITYTPGEHWTVHLRYRLLDLDADKSDQIASYGVSNLNLLPVRDAIDITRAWYETIVNYRPFPKLTFKAELRREDIERSNTGPAQAHHSATTDPVEINSNWQLPDEESRIQAKIGFNSRLLEKSAMKINGWASYKHSDDPAYGTSLEDGIECYLSSSYTPSPRWGVAASLDLIDEENKRTVDQFDDAADIEVTAFDLDRDKEQQTFSAGAWVTPLHGLAIDLNYGFLRTRIGQDLLFGAQPNADDPLRDYTIEDEDVAYRQTVQTISAGATWRPIDRLIWRLEGYHIRSKADFDPQFSTATYEFLAGADIIPGTASSDDLREISRIDIRQSGVRGRLTWRATDNWTAGFVATFDDYDDDDDFFDGSVQTYMANLAVNW